MEWWPSISSVLILNFDRDYSYEKFMFMKHIIVKYSINGLHNVKKKINNNKTAQNNGLD